MMTAYEAHRQPNALFKPGVHALNARPRTGEQHARNTLAARAFDVKSQRVRNLHHHVVNLLWGHDLWRVLGIETGEPLLVCLTLEERRGQLTWVGFASRLGKLKRHDAHEPRHALF